MELRSPAGRGGALISAERLGRWWLDRPPIRSTTEALAFLDDVGFAQLFGRDGRFPSLREVSRDETCERTPDGWGEDLEALWTWKDQLPVSGDAWYGRLLAGTPSLVTSELLALLYDQPGGPDDAAALPGDMVGAEAKAITRFLADEGPTSTRMLREIVCGGSASRLDRARTQLGRSLLVTHFGVEDGPAGWASCVLELTVRAFPQLQETRPDRATRDVAVARQFVDTMVVASPQELSRAFAWPRDRATDALRAVTDG